MGKVIFNMTMSLDGFVAGPNDGPQNPLGDGGMALFDWYGRGDTAYKMPGGDWKFQVAAASAANLDRAIKNAGALVTGRRTFAIANAWGGQHPVDVPVAVAHTISYDGEIMGDTMSGNPAALAQFAGITTPTLVMVGSESPPYQQTAVATLAKILPNAAYRSMAGQDHGVAPAVLNPALVEFFLGG